MHQVLGHLLARQNKQVPIDDGRKVVLVLYGGSMTCVRTVAVMQVLQELKLTSAFDEIYAISGSFPIASYFLSGQSDRAESIFLENLSGGRFISLKRFWQVFDTDYLLQVFRDKFPVDLSLLRQSNTRLFLAAHNLSSKKIEYLNLRDYLDKDHYKLLEISATPDYFSPGTISLNGSQYKDVPFRNFTHKNHFAQAGNSAATDILVVFNYARQRKKVFSEATPDNTFVLAPDPKWHLSRFETRIEKLKEQHRLMKDYARQILSGIINSDD
ncbi:MAG: hypothetical protein HY395_00520 [Candidatus Doudnabacteria bacterium]|nr:hypothetical protein [Candidatus Doudnabacteria bacterium]